MCRFLSRRRCAWLAAALMVATPPPATAHTMTMTEVIVSVEQPGRLDVKVAIDLTQILGSPERYYQIVSEPWPIQQEDIQKILPRVTGDLQLYIGRERLDLEFRHFEPAASNRSLIVEGSMSILSTFHFVATLPAALDSLQLVIPVGADIDYPVVFSIQIPAAHVSVTRWLEDGMHASVPYPLDDEVLGTATIPWPHQATQYLRLGLSHIVPQGVDHILFVLGLFFLGITWRKLLSQTTVFTVAHATTLFLSAYGILRLPSRYVEPAIALSIAWIAIENVLKPRLSAGRLAVVFGFGLVHGLGFASSLSGIPFPKRDFLVALLGFNVGVDLGQLCIIGAAFLVVGWFRHAPWYRARIAIPCSLAIAAIGLSWAIQRITFYGGG